MDEYVNLLVYLAGPAIIAVVGAIAKLWSDFNSYKLHVSEAYMRRDSLGKLENKLDSLSRVVYEIAGKLNVPVQRDNA